MQDTMPPPPPPRATRPSSKLNMQFPGTGYTVQRLWEEDDDQSWRPADLPPKGRCRSKREIDMLLPLSIFWAPNDKSTHHDNYPRMLISTFQHYSEHARSKGENFPRVTTCSTQPWTGSDAAETHLFEGFIGTQINNTNPCSYRPQIPSTAPHSIWPGERVADWGRKIKTAMKMRVKDYRVHLMIPIRGTKFWHQIGLWWHMILILMRITIRHLLQRRRGILEVLRTVIKG